MLCLRTAVVRTPGLAFPDPASSPALCPPLRMQSPPPPPPANLPIITYEGYSYVAIAGGNTRVSSLAAAQDLCKVRSCAWACIRLEGTAASPKPSAAAYNLRSCALLSALRWTTHAYRGLCVLQHLQTLGSDAKVFTWDTAAELKAIGDALKAVRDQGNTGLMNYVRGRGAGLGGRSGVWQHISAAMQATCAGGTCSSALLHLMVCRHCLRMQVHL